MRPILFTIKLILQDQLLSAALQMILLKVLSLLQLVKQKKEVVKYKYQMVFSKRELNDF